MRSSLALLPLLLRAPPLLRKRGAAQSELPLSRPPLFLPSPHMCAAPVEEEQIARRVGEWCLATPGREEASVLLSPACSTPEMLRDFWSVALDMGQAEAVGTYVVAFPNWEDGAAPRYFQAVSNHLMACGECCEHVGDSIMVSARHPAASPTEEEPMAAPCPMLLLKSFKRGADFDESTDPFGPDSIFADGDNPFAEPPPPPPPPDETVLAETRKVERSSCLCSLWSKLTSSNADWCCHCAVG